MTDERRLRAAGRDLAFTRLTLGASLLVSSALAVALATRNAKWWIVLGLIVASGAAATRRMGVLHGRGRGLGPFLALALVNLLVVVPELGLRVGNFRYQSGIQFGYPRPRAMIHLVPDERLFWRLPASRSDVNRLGFPGEDPQVPKPAGTYRVLFLGDSCTYQGYPAIADRLLAARLPEGPDVDVVNLSVAGYSSHQGRIVAETVAPPLEPDLAFVYYGWNDHWLAYGAIDADKVVAVPRGLRATRIWRELANLRLVQLTHRLGNLLRISQAGRPLREVRVPAEHYRSNLEAIHDVFSRLGVPVVFVTAPTTHPRRGPPARLVKEGYAVDAESIVRMHREYNEISRQVAANHEDAFLFDLARELERSGELEQLFLSDGIHFSAHGAEAVAARVADCIEEFVRGRPIGVGRQLPTIKRPTVCEVS